MLDVRDKMINKLGATIILAEFTDSKGPYWHSNT